MFDIFFVFFVFVCLPRLNRNNKSIKAACEELVNRHESYDDVISFTRTLFMSLQDTISNIEEYGVIVWKHHIVA